MMIGVLCMNVSHGDLKKWLLVPVRVPSTDHNNNSTQVQLDKPMQLLELPYKSMSGELLNRGKSDFQTGTLHKLFTVPQTMTFPIVIDGPPFQITFHPFQTSLAPPEIMKLDRITHSWKEMQKGVSET